MERVQDSLDYLSNSFEAVLTACVSSNFFGPMGGLICGAVVGLTLHAVRSKRFTFAV